MLTTRKVIEGNKNLTLLQIAGLSLLCLGILLLIICGFSTLRETNTDTAFSGLAATGFFNIMLGMALLYPKMLAGSSGAASTMRMSIFMIVSVFVVLVVKVGWGTASLDKFTLNQTWAYVLAVALGSKAMQYFGEKLPPLVGSKSVITGNSADINAKSPPIPGTIVLSPFSATRNVPQTPPFHILEVQKINP